MFLLNIFFLYVKKYVFLRKKICLIFESRILWILFIMYMKTNDYFNNININVSFLLKKIICKLARLKEIRINYFPTPMA